MGSMRLRIWEILDTAKPGDRASRVFDVFILALIFLNVLAVIFGTVQSVHDRWGTELLWFEIVSVVVFTLEYLGRMWACTSGEEFARPIAGRIKFAFRPMTLIDLVAILPFYLPFIGLDMRFVRILRLFRIVRIAKVGRYYTSLRLITRVFRDKKEELVLTSFIMIMLLVLSASVMYYCENETQPEAFPDIPATLWWSAATLTTVGYGDIYPITTIGRLMGSLIAILGIGMFALPTGILVAGFVEAIQAAKQGGVTCPHCGKRITEEANRK